jgi:Tfp pilus assembly protein FimT
MTAVELVIVLAIVAILGFAAYPLLSNIRQVLLVKGASEQAAGAIRLARQFAITQGSNYCVEFRTIPVTQYQIREADTTPACNGTVVNGYAWKDIIDSYNDGTVTTNAPTIAFDPIGNRILPAGTTSTAFNVDTVPASCLSVVTVTIYGGVRVAGC